MVAKNGYTKLSGDEHHHGGDGQCYGDIGLSSEGIYNFKTLFAHPKNKLTVKFQVFAGEYHNYGSKE